MYFAAYESCIYNTSTGVYEDILISGDSAVEITENVIASVSGTGVIMSDRTFTNSNGETDTGDGLGNLKTMLQYNQYSIQTEEALAATQLLFLIEYASFDAKSHIGEGQILLSGTGATAALGNGTGSVESGDVTYRGEENLWGCNWFATETPAAHNLNSTIAESRYIKKYLLKPLDTNTLNMLFTVNRGLSQAAALNYYSEVTAKGIGFCYVAAECSDSAESIVGDRLDRIQVLQWVPHVLHGGKRTNDETAANGLFALYNTNPSTAFTARLFYSSRNENFAESNIREPDMSEEMQ